MTPILKVSKRDKCELRAYPRKYLPSYVLVLPPVNNEQFQ